MNKDVMAGCKPLKRGEYDLVNISLVGHDPVTGRTFKECNAEWRVWMDEVEAGWKLLRWWQLRQRLRLGRYTAILGQRMGMGGHGF